MGVEKMGVEAGGVKEGVKEVVKEINGLALRCQEAWKVVDTPKKMLRKIWIIRVSDEKDWGRLERCVLRVIALHGDAYGSADVKNIDAAINIMNDKRQIVLKHVGYRDLNEEDLETFVNLLKEAKDEIEATPVVKEFVI